MKNRRKKRAWLSVILIAVAAGAVVLTMGIIKMMHGKAETHLIEIIPTGQQNDLVETDTDFLITAPKNTLPSRSVFEKMITISPETAFELEENENGYLLSMNGNFEPDSMVKLQLTMDNGNKKSWAFQTVSAFSVVSHTPEHGKQNVFCGESIRVTFSSADIEMEEFSAAFSIEPKVEGHFEKYGATMVFVPDEPLTLYSEYWVTIGEEMQNTAGDHLQSAVEFRFVTADEDENADRDGKILNSAEISENFLPKDKPVISYRTVGEVSFADAFVEVWRYETAEAYREALENYLEKTKNTISDAVQMEIETDHLELMMRFEGAENFGEFEGSHYAVFPETLDEGWYLAKLTASEGNGENCSLFKFIQISDWLVYSTETEKNHLFWINRADSGETVAGAAVTLVRDEKSLSATTADNGVVCFENVEGSARKGLLEIVQGEKVFLSLYGFATDEPAAVENYDAYICADRCIYGSEDTISFWGSVISRNNAEPLKKVTVMISDEERCFYCTEAETAADGSFSGEWQFKGLSGSLKLSVVVDDTVIFSRYVEISDEKADYEAAISLDKNICFAGEKITAEIYVNDADGKPAAGMEVAVFVGESDPISAITDENGMAVVDLTAETEGNFWEPKSCDIVVRSAEGELEVRTSCTVVGRDVAVYGKYDAASGRVKVYADYIVLPEEGQGDSVYANDYAVLKGAAADKKVQGTLYRVWSTATVDQEASYYDFLQDKRVKVYKYKQHEQVVKRYKFQTGEDGDYIDGLPELDENSSYYMLITAKDSQGRTSAARIDIQISSGYANYYGRKNYSYAEVPGKRESENILRLRMNGDWVEEGQVFTILKNEKGIEYTVKDADDDFPDGDDNRSVVYGAYFDGKRLYEIAPYSSSVPETQKLSVEMTQEEEKLHIRALHTDNTPAANAAGVVLILDKSQPTEKILGNFFDEGQKEEPNVYCSYEQYTLVPMKQEENEDSTMEQYRADAGWLGQFTTDHSGNAVVTLPEQDMRGKKAVAVVIENREGYGLKGRVEQELQMTTAFLLKKMMPETLIAGEEFSVTLYCTGYALEDRIHTIEYTCALRSAYRYSLDFPGTDVIFKTTAGNEEYVTFNFGKLNAGEYTVSLTATCGEYETAEEIVLVVNEGRKEKNVLHELSVNELLEFRTERYPVVLCVVPQKDVLRGKLIGSLMAAEDNTLSGYAAELWLQNKYAANEEAQDAWVKLFNANGFSESGEADDVFLTAKWMLLQKDAAVQMRMREYFLNVLEQAADSHAVAAGYLGLAACGEAVLMDIRYLLENEDFETQDKLILTAALAALGDDDGAEYYFKKTIEKDVKAYRDDEEHVVYFVSQRGEEDSKQLTAAAALTSAILHDEYAEGFVRYFVNETECSEYIAEKLICLSGMTRANDRARISYVYEGESCSSELTGENILLLHLSYKQMKELNLQCPFGGVAVIVGSRETAAEKN